ncbi:MAG TPA: tetratricopeptide repeat protein, partial [Ktedonobacteraceae bacterium]|nr:tetratricopeptide repeat protein [Ktedonobacteraceae bacterium]
LEDLLAFKIGGPACVYVVTTRFPQIAMQFATDEVIALEELNEGQSMALLSQMLPYLAQDEPEALNGLVHAVGGLPLALTLMGRYLLTQTHSHQPRRARAALERLCDAETRLKLSVPQALLGRSPALPAQSPVSLQTVIAVSNQQLDEEARRVLQALPVFPPKPDTFSEEAALAVAATTEETLDALSDAGLLEGRAGRYTLHQTIADYARSALFDSAPYQRFIAYFVSYIEKHQRDYDALDRERTKLLTALDTAFTHHQCAELMRGLKHGYAFLEARGLYELAEHYLRLVEHCWESADASTRGQMRFMSGRIAELRNDLARAQICYEEALQLARESGITRDIGVLLAVQGACNVRIGNYEQAEEKLQEALSIARWTQDSAILIRVLGSRGAMANERGNFAEGEAYLIEALELIRQTGQQESLFQILNNLCSSTAEQGKYGQAEGYQLEFVELARQLGHREKLCGSLCNLGALYSFQQKYEQAKRTLEEALSIAHQLDHGEWT